MRRWRGWRREEGEREEREGGVVRVRGSEEGEGGGRDRGWSKKRSCQVQKHGQANQHSVSGIR